MRHKPRLSYSGLTVVLSNPSRFDKHELLSGMAGHFFQTKCLDEKVSRHSVDLRTSDTLEEGLLSNTKGLLLLGDNAFQKWTEGAYREYSLDEQRGCPLKTRFLGIPCIASYFPQDCLDIQDYESKFNPTKSEGETSQEYEAGEEDDNEVKKKGRTSRKNYRFWLEHDTKKLLSKFDSRFKQHFISSTNFKTRIAPSSEDISSFFKGITSYENLFLDIETSIDGGYNLFCIGCATDTSDVFVIPLFRWDGSFFYSWDITCRLLRELSYAMARCNSTVTHNGFAFDLLILSWRYRIPIGHNHYDTMVAHHRVFPEIEKSLGHCMSLWTDEEYHKDEGCFNPHNMNDLVRLMKYNAKDVHGMRLIKAAIDKYSTSVPGLSDSIVQGNRCIYPYTLTSLSGINFDDEERQKIITENDRLMTQYLRWLEILKGKEYKTRVLPTSSKSCVMFFHDYLNYDVVSRSRNISKRTGKPLNTPSLNEKALYKLKLKYPQNIMIDICIAYRRRKKESGMLGFEPWDINKLPC